MISSADFSDVFACPNEPRPRGELRRVAEIQHDACIARWEDDGGLIRDSVSPDAVSLSNTADTHDHDPLAADILFSFTPALAVMWATATIVAISGGLTESQERGGRGMFR